jgi:hypothetical protein
MKSHEKLNDTLHEIFDHLMNFDSSTDYFKWYVGITSEPDSIKINQKTTIKHLKYWNLEDKLTANTVKYFLIEKGCKVCKSELSFKIKLKDFIGKARFIYVYKNE